MQRMKLKPYPPPYRKVDSKWTKSSNIRKTITKLSEENREKYYIALRHYDKNTKKTDKTKARKLSVYRPLRDKCNEIQSANTDIIEKLGIRENYQESDLLFIQIDKLERKYNNDFEKDPFAESGSFFNVLRSVDLQKR